jgi:hypothetical protein
MHELRDRALGIAARRVRLGRILAAAALFGGAACLWGGGPHGPARMPDAVLTSATGFGLSGTAGNLAPGAPSTLVVTAANPYSVPITLTSLTVSVPAVPANCPASNLTLRGTAFTGSPPTVTVTGLSQIVPANGSASVSLAILLARNAANGCQNVTFPFSYSGTASYTAATTTTVASSGSPSLFGHPVTVTATVTASAPAANPPPGAVTFYVCASPSNLAPGSPAAACTTPVALGPAVPLGASGQASLTTPDLPGGSYPVLATFAPSDATNYSASSSASMTQVVTFSKPCITTTVPGFTVAAGQSVCIAAPANVTSSVTVASGGALSVTGGMLSGGLNASGAAALRLCGGTVSGAVSVSGATGFVQAGDGGDDGQPACAGNTLKGGLTLTGNSGGFEAGGNKITGAASVTGNTGTGPPWQDAAAEIEGNSISGPLSCANNSPAPTDDGQRNTVSGTRSGQCSAAGF